MKMKNYPIFMVLLLFFLMFLGLLIIKYSNDITPEWVSVYLDTFTLLFVSSTSFAAWYFSYCEYKDRNESNKQGLKFLDPNSNGIGYISNETKSNVQVKLLKYVYSVETNSSSVSIYCDFKNSTNKKEWIKKILILKLKKL